MKPAQTQMDDAGAKRGRIVTRNPDATWDLSEIGPRESNLHRPTFPTESAIPLAGGQHGVYFRIVRELRRGECRPAQQPTRQGPFSGTESPVGQDFRFGDVVP